MTVAVLFVEEQLSSYAVTANIITFPVSYL